MPPEIEITSGSPGPDDERAVRAAILALWREDQACAAQSAAGLPGWIRAAREEATGAGMLGSRAWRAGFTQPGVLPARRVGRGDQR